jgi:hypothetical protein
MSPQEKPSNFSQELKKIKEEEKKIAQEEEFGPIRPKKETEEDRAKLVELAKKSLGL